MPDRIAEIRAREEAASDDWTVSAADPGVVLAEGQPIAVFGGGPQDYLNAAFTAHAHDDIRWLLAFIQGAIATGHEQQRYITQLLAEVAELQAKLEVRERQMGDFDMGVVA